MAALARRHRRGRLQLGKTSVDAFNEAYHVAATHPQTLEFTDDVNVPLDCYERHTRMIFREAIASPRHPGHGTVTPLIGQYFLADVTLDFDQPYRLQRVEQDALAVPGVTSIEGWAVSTAEKFCIQTTRPPRS